MYRSEENATDRHCTPQQREKVTWQCDMGNLRKKMTFIIEHTFNGPKAPCL